MVAIAHIDDSGLRRKTRTLAERAAPAGLEVARSGADHFVEFMVEKAPRDTRRYVRAWVQAGNQAGLTRRPVPPLQESRWQAQFLDALERQIERHVDRINTLQGMLDRWYYSKGRPLGSWARRKQREIERRTRYLIKAVEHLRRFQNASAPVLFFAGAEAAQFSGTGIWRDVRRRASTIRDKVYGGRGAVVEEGGEARIVLHNLEPHVTLVERRTRLVGRGRAAVKRYTDAVGKRQFLRNLGGRRVLAGELG